MNLKRKGQSQAGIQQFLPKRVSLPAVENEQGEIRERTGQEQGTSSLLSSGQKSFRCMSEMSDLVFFCRDI